MATLRYDLLIIGSGPAGLAARNDSFEFREKNADFGKRGLPRGRVC